MTRLSSNLIKSNYIYFDHQEKRVIDSNDRSESFVSFSTAHTDIAEEVLKETGVFISGLNAINVKVEQILQEQNSETTEDVQDNAEDILNQARAEAEEILNNAREQAELIKMQAYEEGKEQGYSDGVIEYEQKTTQMEMELNEKILQNERDYEQHLMNLEPEFVDIMIALIEKITGIVIEDKKDIILHLVDRAMKQDTKSNQYMIRASKEDYEFLEDNKDKLYHSAGDEAQILIEEDKSLAKNQCILETDTKIIDCSLDIQLKNLCEDLKLLSRI